MKKRAPRIERALHCYLQDALQIIIFMQERNAYKELYEPSDDQFRETDSRPLHNRCHGPNSRLQMHPRVFPSNRQTAVPAVYLHNAVQPHGS